MFPAAKILPVSTVGSDLQLTGGMIILRGWSFQNPSDADSTSVALFDGTSGQGGLIALVDLLPSESTREWFSGGGIAVPSGLFLQVGAADVVGSIFYSDATLVAGIAFVNGALEAWRGQL